MESFTILSKATFGLIFVVLLIYATIKVLNKYIKYGPNAKNSSNIKIDSVFFIDHQNKIVNIDSNNQSYLILVSPNGNLLLNKNDKN